MNIFDSEAEFYPLDDAEDDGLMLTWNSVPELWTETVGETLWDEDSLQLLDHETAGQ